MAARKTQTQMVLRKREVLKEMSITGVWNIDVKTLASKHEVSIQQICDDRRKLIRKLPKDKIDEIRPVLLQFYKNAMVKTNNIVNDGEASRKEILVACKVLSDLCKDFTAMLEAYGLKEKVAEQEDVNIVLRWKKEDE